MGIVMIEGCRHSGKTHLINDFFAQNKNPNVIYYKFKFAKYIEDFGMRDQESGPGVHYFSIGNILTILELNETLLKDKIVIFDRCIYSAYVWSVYRNRLDHDKLYQEFRKILASPLYSKCTLLYVDRDPKVKTQKREKDYFGNFEDLNREKEIFGEILDQYRPQASDSTRGNSFLEFTNNFDDASAVRFCQLMNELVKQK
jgi:hypothetical protein